MAIKNSTQRRKNLIPNVQDIQKTLHKNLEFTATEQYKLLRANLAFTLPPKEGCAIIGVTSSMRGEGKSTTAVNLSYVLAEAGNKVLLIDGDLRIPSVAKKMRLANSPGLTDCLRASDPSSVQVIEAPNIKNWFILPSGTLPPNPSELLGSQRMEQVLQVLAKNYDYIIVDLPPVNLVSDAIAISKYIDGMLLVVREDYTEKQELEHCVRQLELSSVKVLGCVMNESNNGKSSYGRYKYKRYYRYYKYSSYD